MPGYLLSYAKFRERYETDIVRGDPKAAEKFKKLVSPFILRRLKTEVLSELPPKIETDIVSPLADEQAKLYSANLQLIRDSLKETGEKTNKIVVLSMLTKLRQICCEPRLVYPDYKGNSAKFETCMELLESAISGGHKVLLFSQFTQMIEIFRDRFAKDGITHYVLKGDTVKSERMRLVNKFNEDGTNVFLISLKAGGTGLNLTGADVVIHYDPWWNESVTNQATDRAYRIGQNKPVQVYKLVLENTVEQRILELQKKKSALSNMVLGGTLETVRYEELMKILSE
jgi:SNF2 family DNA or RNA helicase